MVSIGDVENALERIYQESMDVGLSWGPEFGELTDDSDAYDSEDSEYGLYLDRKEELTIYNEKNRTGEILRYGIDFWGFDDEDDKGLIKTQIMNYLDPTETHSCTWDEYECEGDWDDVVTLLKKKNKWNVFEDVLKDGSAEVWQMLQAIATSSVTQASKNSKKETLTDIIIFFHHGLFFSTKLGSRPLRCRPTLCRCEEFEQFRGLFVVQ